MRDPRATRAYRAARAEWLPTQHGRPCALCGVAVDVRVPHGPMKATVEHTVPVRTIVATSPTWADAVALTCDVSLWQPAHSHCQSRQGAQVSNVTRHGKPERRPSRQW